MKRIPYLTGLLFAVLLVPACKNNSNANFEGGGAMKDMAMEIMDASVPPPPPPPASARYESDVRELSEPALENPGSPVSRKIIKDGNMEIRVSDLQQGKKQVDTLVHTFNAFYSNENFNNTEYSRGYSLSIRIPAANFDAFIASIEKGSAEVAYKNISMRDVTEEYIDLDTRLTNKKNYLGRYNELLKQAKTVKDMLEIQENMRTIEEELESVQGRLKYLNNQIDYSTLILQITKKNDFNIYNRNTGKFIDRLKLSLVKGWFGLVGFVLFIIKIWPFWLILALVVYVIRKFWKGRKRKDKTAKG